LSPFSLLGEGSAMALVALALFVTVLALLVALVFVVVTALIVVIAFADCCEPFVVYPQPSTCRRRRTTPPPPPPRLRLSSVVICLLTWFSPLVDASPMKTWFLFAPSHPNCCWTIAAQRCDISFEYNSTSPFSSLEALAGESLHR
jgi:hypothetical protein